MADVKQASGITDADKKVLLYWEIGAFFFIMLFGSFFHFIYELSGFNGFAALFGSVNESTWEHLKLFFWPGIVFFGIQHAFIKDRVNNYWYGKAMALLITPVGVITSFYFYLGIALPIYGEGFLWADISTGAIGVLAGNIVAYRILTAPPRERVFDLRGRAIIIGMIVVFLLLTYFPPRFFLFEDFFGYEYNDQFGILEDYTDYLVFDRG